MLLTLRGLGLTFGSTVLLEDVALTVARGERIAVLGRNGMGKTTLMRLIEGEIAADQGEIVRAQHFAWREAALTLEAQGLVDVGLLEKRRGLGMFVTDGARSSLTSDEKQRFIEEEVPAFAERVRMLGMEMTEVVQLLLETRGGK